MSGKHTPGPWEWTCHGLIPSAHKGRSFGFSIHEQDNLNHYAMVIVSEGSWGGKRVAERQANNRLIFAAPDLLEALENVAPYLNAMFNGEAVPAELVPTGGQLFAMNRAIAKARGEA